MPKRDFSGEKKANFTTNPTNIVFQKKHFTKSLIIKDIIFHQRKKNIK